MTLILCLLAGVAGALVVLSLHVAGRVSALERRVDHRERREMTLISSVQEVQGQYLRRRNGMDTGRFARPAHASDHGPS